MCDQRIIRFLGVGVHDGNVLNGPGPVWVELKRRGYEVTVCLQKGYSAADSYRNKSSVHRLLGSLDVRCFDRFPEAGFLSCYNAVVSAMSPLSYSMETNVAGFCNGYARYSKRPLFVVEDTVSARRNGSWSDFVSDHDRVKALYAPVSANGHVGCREVVVGPMVMNRWRGVNVEELARTARQKLGISDAPVLYFSPSPEKEGGEAFVKLATLIKDDRGTKVPDNAVFLLNRHRRELTQPVEGNGQRYAWGQRILMQAGFRVIDNSPEFGDIGQGDIRCIMPECRPPDFLTYPEMLVVTHGNGVAVSFFSTDVLMVAPHLPGIAPVLWLDEELGGAVLLREKHMKCFADLHAVIQPTRNESLMSAIGIGFGRTGARSVYCTALSKAFPFPTSDPVQTICDDILRQMD